GTGGLADGAVAWHAAESPRLRPSGDPPFAGLGTSMRRDDERQAIHVNQMAHPRPDRQAAAAGDAARPAGIIRSDRIMTDALMTYAYSGDASSYRLVPAVVVIINTEDEVRAVIEAARAERLPLTFRAAGTSLSGQAITDG